MSSIARQAVGLQKDIERCGLAHWPYTILKLRLLLRLLYCLYLHAVAFGDLFENGCRRRGIGVNTTTAVMEE